MTVYIEVTLKSHRTKQFLWQHSSAGTQRHRCRCVCLPQLWIHFHFHLCVGARKIKFNVKKTRAITHNFIFLVVVCACLGENETKHKHCVVAWKSFRPENSNNNNNKFCKRRQSIEATQYKLIFHISTRNERGFFLTYFFSVLSLDFYHKLRHKILFWVGKNRYACWHSFVPRCQLSLQ